MPVDPLQILLHTLNYIINSTILYYTGVSQKVGAWVDENTGAVALMLKGEGVGKSRKSLESGTACSRPRRTHLSRSTSRATTGTKKSKYRSIKEVFRGQVTLYPLLIYLLGSVRGEKDYALSKKMLKRQGFMHSSTHESPGTPISMLTVSLDLPIVVFQV